jgi:cell fate regulator YaaT (PSP1 superfamily)
MSDAPPPPGEVAEEAPERGDSDAPEQSQPSPQQRAEAPPAQKRPPAAKPAGKPTPPEAPPKRPAPQPPNVIIRYGLMQQLGAFRCNWSAPPAPGCYVVVRTERGVELAQVVSVVGDGPAGGFISRDRLDGYVAASGAEYPLRRGGKVLRTANQQDLIDYRHLRTSAAECGAYCRQQIRELGLEMKLVAVEHLLGGERIVFYFTSATRVDFRELVRRLAGQYHTRIEMRQVGARDEARLVADYERCGRRCCCKEFLQELKPVSMRMAKTQKATLDPAKISGRCGRLMCCLRYEDAGYEELRKKLPRKNTYVRTSWTVGRVAETQILSQLVKLTLPDGNQAVVANEEIIERDVPAPRPDERPARTRPAKAPPRPAPREPQPAAAAAEKAEAPESPPVEAAPPEPRPAPEAPAPAPAAAADEPAEGEKPKKRRRRRRRKKRPGTRGQHKPAPQGQAPQSKKKNRRRRRRKPPRGNA